MIDIMIIIISRNSSSSGGGGGGSSTVILFILGLFSSGSVFVRMNYKSLRSMFKMFLSILSK